MFSLNKSRVFSESHIFIDVLAQNHAGKLKTWTEGIRVNVVRKFHLHLHHSIPQLGYAQMKLEIPKFPTLQGTTQRTKTTPLMPTVEETFPHFNVTAFLKQWYCECCHLILQTSFESMSYGSTTENICCHL